MEEYNIKVVYHDNGITPITHIKKFTKGDWYDLRCQGAKIIKNQSNVSLFVNPNDLDMNIEGCTMHSMNDSVYLTDDETGYRIFILSRGAEETMVQVLTGLYEGEKVKYIKYNAGDFLLLNLGISMVLPEEHEAYVVPRGSTFKNYGLIQTNSPGIVDCSFNGPNDIWFMPVYALKDGFIILDERVCQFRIQEKMTKTTFEVVDNLDENEDRGSHGHSGTR